MPPKRFAKYGGGGKGGFNDKRTGETSITQGVPVATQGLPMVGRPHTRAFTKLQTKLREDNQQGPEKKGNQIPEKRNLKSKQQIRRPNGSLNRTSKRTKRPSGAGIQSKEVAPRAPKKSTQASKQIPKTPAKAKANSRKPVRQEQSTHPPLSSVSRWLDSLPQDSDLYFEEGMAPSITKETSTEVFSRTPRASTANPKQNNISLETYLEKLHNRRAYPEESVIDPKTPGLQKHLQLPNGIQIPSEDTAKLVAHAREFISKCEKLKPGENGYQVIEEFKAKFNNELPQKVFTLSNQDFQHDLDRAKNANEAIFQRTVLLSIIDRWRLTEDIDYDCEGLWSAHNTFPIPIDAPELDHIMRKKPDLALYFTRKSVVHDQPRYSSIPKDILSCMSPDDKTHRCFPFLFVEAKKRGDDIIKAKYDGMLAASQALYNIFQCMRLLGKTKEFFSDVRVFSIAINAHIFTARIHRAEETDDGGMQFVFDTIVEPKIFGYNRDDIGIVIRTILVHYALKDLLRILRETYKGLRELFAKEKTDGQKAHGIQKGIGSTTGHHQNTQTTEDGTNDMDENEADKAESERADGDEELQEKEVEVVEVVEVVEEPTSKQAKRRNRGAKEPISKSKTAGNNPNKRMKSHLDDSFGMSGLQTND